MLSVNVAEQSLFCFVDCWAKLAGEHGSIEVTGFNVVSCRAMVQKLFEAKSAFNVSGFPVHLDQLLHFLLKLSKRCI